MNYQSLIISIILSGTLGFLNYNLLINQGTFSSYSSKEDRTAWCASFSIVNYLIYIRIYEIIHTTNIDLSVFYTVLLTCGVSLLITLVIFPLINWLVVWVLNLIRDGKQLSGIANSTPRENAFEHNCGMQVYIFDFEHQFISSGYIDKYTESIELEHQILLDPQRDMPSELCEDEVIELMNEQYLEPDKNVKDTKIYLDTKSQLKYYIIYLLV